MKKILPILTLFLVFTSFAKAATEISQEVQIIKSNTQYGEEILEYHRYRQLPKNLETEKDQNQTNINVTVNCNSGCCNNNCKKNEKEPDEKWIEKKEIKPCNCVAKKKKQKPKAKTKPKPKKKIVPKKKAPKTNVIIKKIYIYQESKAPCSNDEIHVNIENTINSNNNLRCE